ncbi:HupE/UreJ family protein [Actinocorallia sp. B10E7]|uniref:HupE/UreJ family protein n=1 Tax=Actinocorallia sp. B10E7 TaxID=3153558 RepID=UPI00325CA99D
MNTCTRGGPPEPQRSSIIGRAAVRRAGMIGLPAVAAVLAVPEAAYAHGVTNTSGSTPSFIWSGFVHMLAGWDHLLFVAGVLLLAGTVKRAAQMISLFALGHSLTLIAATMAEFKMNATFVDVVIALSLVFVAVVGWIGRPQRWTWFGVAVFGFGLIHGLGLSTRLQELGLPHEVLRQLLRVVAFNIGVEFGQLAAIIVMFAAGTAVAKYITWPHAWKTFHGALAAVGVVSAVLLAFGVIGVVSEDKAKATGSGVCQVRDRTETYPGAAGGTHPAKLFFEPSETTPMNDFGHVLGDGVVLIHYRPDLAADQLTQLRDFVTGNDVLVGGPAPGQAEALKAVGISETLVCTALDLDALAEFANT